MFVSSYPLLFALLLPAIAYFIVHRGPEVAPHFFGKHYASALRVAAVGTGLLYGAAVLLYPGVFSGPFILSAPALVFLLYAAVGYYLVIYLIRYHHYCTGELAEISNMANWKLVVTPPVALAITIAIIYITLILLVIGFVIYAAISAATGSGTGSSIGGARSGGGGGSSLGSSDTREKREWEGGPPQFGRKEAAESRPTTDWFGNPIIEHFDSSGAKIGESRPGTDWFGRQRMEHYDAEGRRVGESYPGKDWLGFDRVEHFDRSSSKTGESRPSTDWLGMPRAEHFDTSGRKAGESRPGTDWLGMPRIEHFDREGRKGGKRR